jgi:hypothetical protein
VTELERELEAWPHGVQLRVKATGEVFETSSETTDGYVWLVDTREYEPIGAILDVTKPLFEQAECVNPPQAEVVIDAIQVQLLGSWALRMMDEPEKEFGRQLHRLARPAKRYKILVVEQPDG